MSVELQGFAATQKRFKDIEKNMNDVPADFKQEVGSILLSDVHTTFANEGPGWPKHDPDTKRGLGILQKTGKSLAAIKVSFAGRNQIKRYMPRSKYWMNFHEKGTGGMPKREFMAKLADASWQLIVEAGKKHILK